MKHKLYSLKEAIRNGIIRIFPTSEEAYNAFLRFQLFVILLTLLLVCCSCGSTKMVTQTVRDISKDTIYLSNTQYDSIYIYQDKLVDRSRDTLYIKDKSIEYRYKLLRDTIRIVQRDSIPYEVTVTEIKEITRPLTLYDKTCRACFWFLMGFLGVYLIRFILKLRKL